MTLWQCENSAAWERTCLVIVRTYCSSLRQLLHMVNIPPQRISVLSICCWGGECADVLVMATPSLIVEKEEYMLVSLLWQEQLHWLLFLKFSCSTLFTVVVYRIHSSVNQFESVFVAIFLFLNFKFMLWVTSALCLLRLIVSWFHDFNLGEHVERGKVYFFCVEL